MLSKRGGDQSGIWPTAPVSMVSEGDEDIDDYGVDGASRNGGPTPGPVHKLSCERCRQRKIRCDRVQPCGTCVHKGVECHFPGGVKPRARRQRALVSNAYEDKIDEISRKLDRICSIVDGKANSPANQSSISGQIPSIYTTTIASSIEPSQVIADEGPESENEGELSLTAHATFAADYAQKAVNTRESTQDLTTSLNALRRAVESSPKPSHAASPQPSAVRGVEISGYQMPPLDIATTVLKILKDSPKVKYFWSNQFDSIGHFYEYFLNVYSGKPSLADIIIVGGGLERLFDECSKYEADAALKAEFKAQASQSAQAFEKALSRLPFLVPTSIDYVLALSIAAQYYVWKAKLHVSWRYIVAAVQMSLSLRLHTSHPFKHEDSEQKRRRLRIFWWMTLMEKMVSMWVGRQSNTQDSDLTVVESCLDELSHGPFPIISKWVDVSILYSRVYNDLYSRNALRQPMEERTRKAREMATELERIRDTRSEVEERYRSDRRRALGEEMSSILNSAEELGHLSAKTLIWRSIPPDPEQGSAYSPECISTAMEALEVHGKCLATLQGQEGPVVDLYIQWALICSPFVPLVVMFCYIVETADPIQLEKLRSLVRTVERVSPDFPNDYGKQLSIFKHMYDVAAKCVEAGARPASSGAMGILGAVDGSDGLGGDNDFEMMMREAGIDISMCAPFSGVEGTGTGLEPPGAEFGGWFEQNGQLFGLMDEDVIQ